MCMHPWFFSIRTPHLGHRLVLTMIQLAVSDSSSHFSSHELSMEQETGRWAPRPQPRQNALPQLSHSTSRPADTAWKALSQPEPGHQRRRRLCSTKWRQSERSHEVSRAIGSEPRAAARPTCRTNACGTMQLQSDSIQTASTASAARDLSWPERYSPQHSRQAPWPHARLAISDAGTDAKHTGQSASGPSTSAAPAPREPAFARPAPARTCSGRSVNRSSRRCLSQLQESSIASASSAATSSTDATSRTTAAISARTASGPNTR
mmetsp:Transcript_9165/g.35860  ORF Transcript_9165/g.35860 Transcript_9165/m.35860 type:complete len:264 (-) Transcript_9165:449-1240(-)